MNLNNIHKIKKKKILTSHTKKKKKDNTKKKNTKHNQNVGGGGGGGGGGVQVFFFFFGFLVLAGYLYKAKKRNYKFKVLKSGVFFQIFNSYIIQPKFLKFCQILYTWLM